MAFSRDKSKRISRYTPAQGEDVVLCETTEVDCCNHAGYNTSAGRLCNTCTREWMKHHHVTVPMSLLRELTQEVKRNGK